jgi:hypothetical protein
MYSFRSKNRHLGGIMHKITKIFFQSMLYLSLISFGFLGANSIPLPLTSTQPENNKTVAEGHGNRGHKSTGGDGHKSGGDRHRQSSNQERSHGQGGQNQGHSQQSHKGKGNHQGKNQHLNHGHAPVKDHNRKYNHHNHWNGSKWYSGGGYYDGSTVYPVYPVGGGYTDYNTQYNSGDEYYDGSQQQNYQNYPKQYGAPNYSTSQVQDNTISDLPDDLQIQVSGSGMNEHQVTLLYGDGTSDQLKVAPNELNTLITIPYNKDDNIYIVVGNNSQIPTMTPENDPSGNWKWINGQSGFQGFWLWISY